MRRDEAMIRGSDPIFEAHPYEAWSYDDISFQTRASTVAASEVDTNSEVAEGVGVHIPIVSAAMDRVTGSRMAIAMSKLGGLGVIHTAMSPQDQKLELRRVKHALNGRIEEPVSVRQTWTIGQVIEESSRYDGDFSTFPVTTRDGRLLGVLTSSDVDFNLDNMDTRVRHVMTGRDGMITGKPDTDFRTAFELMKTNGKVRTLPLVDDQDRVTGMYVFSDVERLMLDNPNNYSLDSRNRLLTAAAVPTDKSALERIELMGDYVDVIFIDSSQGDSKFAFQTVRDIRAAFPDLPLVAGNITNGDSAVELVKAGATGIKVGQGPGANCTTRQEIGIGTPQITAIHRVVKALEKACLRVPVCADGGVVYHGDPGKALSVGADTVMTGAAFAGTDEAPGPTVTIDGITYSENRGMGSEPALAESAVARVRYNAAGRNPLAQGVVSLVPRIGPVAQELDWFHQALKQHMSMQDAADIRDLQRKAVFDLLTSAGINESRPHAIGG